MTAVRRQPALERTVRERPRGAPWAEGQGWTRGPCVASGEHLNHGAWTCPRVCVRPAVLNGQALPSRSFHVGAWRAPLMWRPEKPSGAGGPEALRPGQHHPCCGEVSPFSLPAQLMGPSQPWLKPQALWLPWSPSQGTGLRHSGVSYSAQLLDPNRGPGYFPKRS